MNVVDASAVLAFLQGERGAASVERVLEDGAVCGAANWSEISRRIRAHGRNWDLARTLLSTYHLTIEPVTRDDAEWAARRWRAGEGLSLADRLCLALGERLDATVWTTDRAWGSRGRIRQVR